MQKQISLFDPAELIADNPCNAPLADESDDEAMVSAMEAPVVSRDSVIPKYSNFVVYVDESGDHGMQKLDDKYPVFVLAFCVFHKGHYTRKVVADIENLKFKYFGHDLVV